MRPYVLLLLASCFAPSEEVCEDLAADFEVEREAIQSCDAASECGQVLAGTSCGCTRNWVARLDADTTDFYALLDEADDQSCDLGLESVCDCPTTAGFVCENHTCGWNYVDAYPYLPECHAADGDALTIGEVTIEGDELVVGVAYGGGCESHDVVLCWPDQAFAESNPVQATLELFHDDHDDPCDAVIEEERRFSLLPLRQAWTASYGSAHGTYEIHLGAATVTDTF